MKTFTRCSLLAAALLLAATADAGLASVSATTGRAAAKAPNQMRFEALTVGSSVDEGTTVTTRTDGTAALQLMQGVDVLLGNSTTVEIVKVNPSTRTFRVRLVEGSLTSSLKVDMPVDYAVVTDSGDVSAHGTLYTTAKINGESVVIVFQGTVSKGGVSIPPGSVMVGNSVQPVPLADLLSSGAMGDDAKMAVMLVVQNLQSDAAAGTGLSSALTGDELSVITQMAATANNALAVQFAAVTPPTPEAPPALEVSDTEVVISPN